MNGSAEFSTTREDIHTWFDRLDLDDHCSFGGRRSPVPILSNMITLIIVLVALVAFTAWDAAGNDRT